MALRVYQFGDFQLDLNARMLHRTNGQLVALPARVFDCIAWLIEHRDRAVGRDELIAVVWNRTDVSDNLLVQLVVRARKFLDDNKESQGTIRTVHGFGYQWAAPTRLLDEAEIDEPAVPKVSRAQPESADAKDPVTAPTDETPATHPPRRRPAVIALAVLSVLLLLALGVAGYFGVRQVDSSSAASAPGGTTVMPDVVAVLPVGGAAIADADWTWLRFGLMDFIANRLHEGGQPVISSADVVAIVRDEAVAERAAARIDKAVAARYVLLSTVTRVADRWIVHLQLRDHRGDTREVQASGSKAIDAAREAADQLLERLGKSPPLKTYASASPVTELLQRAKAAAWSNRYDDARQLLESAPEELRNSPEVRLRLARLDFQTGKPDAARKSYADLLAETTAERDPLFRARILNGLGAVNGQQHQFEAADRMFTEAIGLLANLDDASELGTAYVRRGATHAIQQQYPQAREDYAKARIAFEKAGDVRALALVNADEGAMNLLDDRLGESLQQLQQAAVQFENFGFTKTLSVVLGNQIELYLHLLQPTSALDVVARAGTRFDTLENPYWQHQFKYYKAWALLENGRLREGNEMLAALANGIGPDEVGTLAMVRSLQAESDYRAGEFEAVLATVQQATAALPDDDGPDLQLVTRIQIGMVKTRALHALDRDADAAIEVQRFRTWADASGSRKARLYAHLAEAEQAWSEGRHDTALRTYDSLMQELPAAANAPSVRADVVISYGNLLISQGYLDRASAVVGQVAQYADRDFNCALLMTRLYQALGQRDAWQTALDRARSLAGERTIPRLLSVPPGEDSSIHR